MKKRLPILMTICLVLAGCGKTGAPEETVSGDVAEVQIGGDISGTGDNAVTDTSADTPAEPSADAAVDDPQAQADAYISDYLTKEQTLSFANLTGKDLAEIYITFSEGALQNVELLQGNVLKDGAGVHYLIEELSELRTAEHLKLSVTTVATDDTRMEFPAISIWDISATNVVLTTEDDQYTMYLE